MYTSIYYIIKYYIVSVNIRYFLVCVPEPQLYVPYTRVAVTIGTVWFEFVVIQEF